MRKACPELDEGKGDNNIPLLLQEGLGVVDDHFLFACFRVDKVWVINPTSVLPFVRGGDYLQGKARGRIPLAPFTRGN